jgi:hypothetical protein
MSLELFSISFIDTIDTISDTIIKKCKIAYENHGKEEAYKVLNDLLYNKNPSQTCRNLYLYRKAMLQTKKAYVLGEGYIEYEKGSDNIIMEPEWKKKKWSFLDTSDSTLKLRNISGSGYITESQLHLDEYDSDLYYSKTYDSSTKLTVKHRGGKSVIRRKRFDFEYKYSPSKHYRDCYLKSIYDIFKRVFFNTINHTVYNSLSKEEADTLYAILGSLPDGLKLNIIKHIRDYILFEQQENNSQINLSNAYRELFNKLQKIYQVNRDTYGAYSVNTIYENNITNDEKSDAIKNISLIKDEYSGRVMLDKFKVFLSELHDTLLIPFEYIAYMMCALINPRYEAIIEDTCGSIGTHIFGGNHVINPIETSSLGPTKTMIETDTISCLIPNIPLLYDDGVTLYENLFIVSDQYYNFSCYSYNKNKWLTDIPLLSINPIHTLESNENRKLIKIIPCFDAHRNCIIWIIYSDYILTYNCNTHTWITSEDDDVFHLCNLNVSTHLSPDSYIKSIQYDSINALLFILDTANVISIYDLNTKAFTPYSELENQPVNELSNIRDLIILNSSDNDELLVYNDTQVQIIKYTQNKGFILIKQFNYSEDNAIIANIVKLNDEKKIYIIYDNHKIIELSTYTYSPYILQKKIKSEIKPIIGNITYCNLNETIVFATTDNKLYIVHPVYTSKNKISAFELPLDKYVSSNAMIKRYNEYFIQESSIVLFSHSYYAIMAYLESLKQPLSKRT